MKKSPPVIELEHIVLSEVLALLPGLVGGDLLKTWLTHPYGILFPRNYRKWFPKRLEHNDKDFCFIFYVPFIFLCTLKFIRIIYNPVQKWIQNCFCSRLVQINLCSVFLLTLPVRHWAKLRPYDTKYSLLQNSSNNLIVNLFIFSSTMTRFPVL